MFALCSVLITRASHPWYQMKASFLLQGVFPVSNLEGGAIPDQPASGPLSDAGVVGLLSLPCRILCPEGCGGRFCAPLGRAGSAVKLRPRLDGKMLASCVGTQMSLILGGVQLL